MYVSLKDVAARSGVSFQTVSKVLNGRSATVSADTRERILTAARELGYVPNALARGLVQQSTYTIGIVADNLSDWFLSQFVIGAATEARRRNHTALINTVDDRELSYARPLLERRVDGILAAAPSAEEDETAAEILRGPLPSVAIHHVPGGGVPVVGSNHSATGRAAAEHLLSLGHKRFGVIAGPRRRRVVQTRLRGFRSELTAARVNLPKEAIVEADWTSSGGYDAMTALLVTAPKLTAVHVHSDMMAIGAIAALRDHDRDVPKHCSVVSCDDLPFAAHLRPALTTVRVPARETGEQAMSLLLDLIDGKPVRSKVLLDTELIIRSSTARARRH